MVGIRCNARVSIVECTKTVARLVSDNSMELELTHISLEADVYDVRKAVALVLHGPDFFRPK